METGDCPASLPCQVCAGCRRSQSAVGRPQPQPLENCRTEEVRVNPAEARTGEVPQIDESKYLGVLRGSRLWQVVKQRQDLFAPLQVAQRQLPSNERMRPNTVISQEHRKIGIGPAEMINPN